MTIELPYTGIEGYVKYAGGKLFNIMQLEWGLIEEEDRQRGYWPLNCLPPHIMGTHGTLNGRLVNYDTDPGQLLIPYDYTIVGSFVTRFDVKDYQTTKEQIDIIVKSSRLEYEGLVISDIKPFFVSRNMNNQIFVPHHKTDFIAKSVKSLLKQERQYTGDINLILD